MSTRSANATGLPDRRHFLSTFTAASAAAGALGLANAPTLAGEAGPIELMYVEHVRLAKVRDDAFEAVEAAQARYVEPPRLPFRMGMEGRYAVYRVGKKNVCFVDDGEENIAELEALLAPNPFTSGSADFEWHAIRSRRAEKLLTEIKAWKAEAERRAEAAGLTQAETIEREMLMATREHAATIFDMEPTTFRELAFQAATLSCTWNDEIAEDIPNRLMKLAGIRSYWLDEAASSDRKAA